MYVSPQESPYGTFASGVGGYDGDFDSDLDGSDNSLSTFSPGDAVSRLMPPSSTVTSALESSLFPLSANAPGGRMLGGLLQSLGGILGQLAQALGGTGGSNGLTGSNGLNGLNGSNGWGNPNCPSGANGGAGTPGCGTSPQTYYASANGSSTGDPHLAFSANGNTAKWDSMTGHGDLLDSNSFNGGFQLSTQTTTPSANGVMTRKATRRSTGSGSRSRFRTARVTIWATARAFPARTTDRST